MTDSHCHREANGDKREENRGAEAEGHLGTHPPCTTSYWLRTRYQECTAARTARRGLLQTANGNHWGWGFNLKPAFNQGRKAWLQALASDNNSVPAFLFWRLCAWISPFKRVAYLFSWVKAGPPSVQGIFFPHLPPTSPFWECIYLILQGRSLRGCSARSFQHSP